MNELKTTEVIEPKNVAVYARVSTKHEAQMLAFDNQVEWYKNVFARHPDWKLVKMYTDEGLSATSTKKRKGFNQMIEDAYNGEYDLIVTREVSRFARNILDCIDYVRRLRKEKVYVNFLTDFIDSRDDEYESKLSYIAAMAQEESRKTSVRAKCGQEISMKNGVLYGNGNILGYDRVGKDLIINPEQAKAVRKIFDLYLDGNGIEAIKYELEKDGVPTATGKTHWHAGTISRILKNPFYCGTIIYRKQFVPDYLEQKKINNFGDVETITVEGKHDTIVSKEEFAKVQQIMEERRQKQPHLPTGKHPKGKKPCMAVWNNLMVCQCGHHFNRRKWNKTDRQLQYSYQCYDSLCTGTVQTRLNKGLSTEGICDTPMIPEWKLQFMAKHIFKNNPLQSDEIIEEAMKMIQEHISDKNPLTSNESDATIRAKKAEIEKLSHRIDGLIEMRADGDISKDDFAIRKAAAEKRIAELQATIAKTTASTEETEITNPAERLEILLEAMQGYIDFDSDDDIPDSIVDAFVNRIVASKDGFDWYLRYDSEKAQRFIVAGRRGDAQVSSPVLENTHFTTMRRRPLLRSRGNNPGKPLKIAELTVDEAYAREFVQTAPSVHHFKTSQWKDIRIDILI